MNTGHWTFAVEQLLLPAECALCNALLGERDAAHLTCAVCRTRFRTVRPPWCERCGQPEPHFGPCRLCAEWPAALETARSAVWLVEEAQQAVHALKYGGLSRIADDLALVMAPLRPPTGETTGGALIPIPLAARKLRLRGYNQSRLIARELGRAWKIPVEEAVIRVRDNGTQTALTPEARLANVATVFSAAPSGGITDATLVDDVFTTGATLRAAANALQEAGWHRVRAVTFACALTYEWRALADTGS